MVGAATWIGAAVLGALGALARWRVGATFAARLPVPFPVGTLTVNLSGAAVLGLLSGIAAPDRLMFAVGTGFLGGYTTFSTWMVESERLGEAGEVLALLLNLWLSLLTGLGAAAAGWAVGSALR